MTFDVLDPASQSPKDAVAGARLRAQRHHLRFRLAVLGLDVEEVVRSAGGWICDRAMSGWDVTVATQDGSGNSAPVQMLGAVGIDLDGVLGRSVPGPWPHALAVSSELYRSVKAVRSGVRRAVRFGSPKITMWGSVEWPRELGNRVELVQHPLSGGAHLFKAYALRSMSASPDVGDAEVFTSGEARVYTPWSADLLPLVR